MAVEEVVQKTDPAGVDTAPEPEAVPVSATVATASQAKLVWWSFRKHRLAMAGLVVVLLFVFIVVFAEFLAPFHTSTQNSDYTYAPPQSLHVGDRTVDGETSWGLYVHAYTFSQDPESLRITYTEDTSRRIPVRLFAKGDDYRLFGLIPWDRHLIGPSQQGDPMYLLGSDRIGRDQMSRLMYATRISMTVGVVGVLFAFVLGIVLGGVSGYFGGKVDTVIQRLIEFVMAVPSIPLWLGLTAAIPITMGPVNRYFIISVILAIIAWTGLAREVRGRFLALRGEDFVTSAWLDGSSRARVMFRHMLPSFTSHLIAALTLSIPGVILAETALSWLGLGLRPPVVSWGVLLDDATSVRVVSQAPWLLIPGGFVVLAVLALNFIGDGMRDAADPYKNGG